MEQINFTGMRLDKLNCSYCKDPVGDLVQLVGPQKLTYHPDCAKEESAQKDDDGFPEIFDSNSFTARTLEQLLEHRTLTVAATIATFAAGFAAGYLNTKISPLSPATLLLAYAPNICAGAAGLSSLFLPANQDAKEQVQDSRLGRCLTVTMLAAIPSWIGYGAGYILS